SPQLRHEICWRSARAALPPFLSFPFISFSESSIFKGLQKNPWDPPSPPCLRPPSSGARRVRSSSWDQATAASDFPQENVPVMFPMAASPGNDLLLAYRSGLGFMDRK